MTANATVAVLLAGGQARRMGGGDKCLRPLAGRPILVRVIERIGPQVSTMILNANGDPARFDAFGLPVVPDVLAGFAGPLAGVLSGLDWAAAHRPAATHVLSVPTDAPFLPLDLVQRLSDAMRAEDADMACAISDGRDHPVVGLWPVRLAGDLRRAMIEEEIRKVDAWTARYRLARADFTVDPVDPFFNANRPEDLRQAEALAAAGV